MMWAVRYTVTERSTFQATIYADTEEAALAEFRQMSEDLGGAQHVGTWISTEQTDIDLDSIRVEEVSEMSQPVHWTTTDAWHKLENERPPE